MDFAQFLGCDFQFTSLSLLIWQAPGNWDASSVNPSVSEVILVSSPHHSMRSQTSHVICQSVLTCEVCAHPHFT